MVMTNDLVTNAVAFALEKRFGGTIELSMTHQEYDTQFAPGHLAGIRIRYDEEAQKLTITTDGVAEVVKQEAT